MIYQSPLRRYARIMRHFASTRAPEVLALQASPILGIFLGGGNNEGLIGVTYEVVGTPDKPSMRVNPISAMAPGLFRKIFEFNTGKQQNAPIDELPSSHSGDSSTGSARTLSNGCSLARR